MIQNFDIFKDAGNNCYQLRSKSLLFALEFDTKEKEDLFLHIVTAIKDKPGSSLKELKQKISNKDNEAAALEMLHSLHEYQLLPSGMASDLGNTADNTSQRSEQTVIAIAGQGAYAAHLLQAARKHTFKEVVFADFTTLQTAESIEQLVATADFLLVDGNEWSPYHNELINSYCLQYNKPWLYTAGVEDMSVKIGPLFYGRETGCYHCLTGRIRSNHELPHYLQGYESYLRSRKIAARPDHIPSKEIVYAIAANMALLEVTKFLENWCLPGTWRTMLSLNLSTMELGKHALLKKPFCDVCKPQLEYNPAPWLEAITLK